MNKKKAIRRIDKAMPDLVLLVGDINSGLDLARADLHRNTLSIAETLIAIRELKKSLTSDSVLEKINVELNNDIQRYKRELDKPRDRCGRKCPTPTPSNDGRVVYEGLQCERAIHTDGSPCYAYGGKAVWR